LAARILLFRFETLVLSVRIFEMYRPVVLFRLVAMSNAMITRFRAGNLIAGCEPSCV
jgi:hypothetical protein